MFRPLISIVKRDLYKVFKTKIKFFTALVRPLMWLLIVGTGFHSVVKQVGPYDYYTYLVPGLISMVILFSSTLAGLSTASDKNSQVMKLLLIAPISRSTIVFARILSSTIIGIIHVMLFFSVLLLLGYVPLFIPWISVFISVILVAFLCSAIGVLIAVYVKDLENFSAIINFVILPMFFLSGALYPLKNIPEFMKWVMYVNPFTYCVDLLQHSFGMQIITHMSYQIDIAITIGILLLMAITASIKLSS